MAFMVVGLHARFLGDFTALGQYLTVNGLFRIAVPVFLIINGFYFYPELSKDNQVNWLKRVIVLYAVWMAIYSYFWFPVPEFSFAWLFALIYKVIIGYYHLWYISGMIGAAIILLFLRNFSSFILVASVVLTFVCGVLIQYLGNYHIFDGSVFEKLFNYNWFHRNMLLFSYPFFCVGYLINKHSLHNIVSRKAAGFLSFFGLFVLLGESYNNFYQNGGDGGFDNLLSLLLVCPCVFICFMKSNISGKSKEIALYSSAIYFVHALFLNIFRGFIDIGETYLTLLVILVSLFASYFIIKANNKLKFLL